MKLVINFLFKNLNKLEFSEILKMIYKIIRRKLMIIIKQIKKNYLRKIKEYHNKFYLG